LGARAEVAATSPPTALRQTTYEEKTELLKYSNIGFTCV
jgi:hypothetical protein